MMSSFVELPLLTRSDSGRNLSTRLLSVTPRGNSTNGDYGLLFVIPGAAAAMTGVYWGNQSSGGVGFGTDILPLGSPVTSQLGDISLMVPRSGVPILSATHATGSTYRLDRWTFNETGDHRHHLDNSGVDSLNTSTWNATGVTLGRSVIAGQLSTSANSRPVMAAIRHVLGTGIGLAVGDYANVATWDLENLPVTEMPQYDLAATEDPAGNEWVLLHKGSAWKLANRTGGEGGNGTLNFADPKTDLLGSQPVDHNDLAQVRRPLALAYSSGKLWVFLAESCSSGVTTRVYSLLTAGDSAKVAESDCQPLTLSDDPWWTVIHVGENEVWAMFTAGRTTSGYSVLYRIKNSAVSSPFMLNQLGHPFGMAIRDGVPFFCKDNSNTAASPVTEQVSCATLQGVTL